MFKLHEEEQQKEEEDEEGIVSNETMTLISTHWNTLCRRKFFKNCFPNSTVNGPDHGSKYFVLTLLLMLLEFLRSSLIAGCPRQRNYMYLLPFVS